MEITREVLLDADVDEVWQALVRDDVRADWLDDPRPLVVLAAEAGRALTWRWAAPDGRGVASTVTIELERADDGRTRLVVTERAAAPPCSLGAATVDPAAWDRRLLGLELRLLSRATEPALV